jgi:hypothetical protein
VGQALHADRRRGSDHEGDSDLLHDPLERIRDWDAGNYPFGSSRWDREWKKLGRKFGEEKDEEADQEDDRSREKPNGVA